MSYAFTPAQVALMTGLTGSAPQESTAEWGTDSKPPPPPSKDIQQSKPRSLMQPQPLADAHLFTSIMKEWGYGIKVDCGPDWSWDSIEAAVERGLHPMACTPEAYAFFKEEVAYQIKVGFSQVMLWEDIKRLCPCHLKISPVALIPQVGQRGRIILDLSFPVYQEVDGVVMVTQKSVNDTTVLTAPLIPVKEIGKVLPRLLQYMRDTPTGLHILFCKLDISNGFWQLVVHENDCFNFAYVLLQEAGEPVRIVITAVVQMGWVESLGFFCTVTESARDLTQHFVDHAVPLPQDPVEDLLQIANVPLRTCSDTPAKLLQVHADNFCHAATQSTDGMHIPTIRRAAIHGIHALFPPTLITNHDGGKESISQKKLAQGDGHFETSKDMIGFCLDGIKHTVCLPAEKAMAYIKEAHTVL
jgi:hypothetical protein